MHGNSTDGSLMKTSLSLVGERILSGFGVFNCRTFHSWFQLFGNRINRKLKWRNEQHFTKIQNTLYGSFECDNRVYSVRFGTQGDFSISHSRFLQSTRNRRPIARPRGRAMGCLLWVLSLLYFLCSCVVSSIVLCRTMKFEESILLWVFSLFLYAFFLSCCI